MRFLDPKASSVTLHCLTGCALGEIVGLILASLLGFGTLASVTIAFLLAFLFGYSLSMIPLVQTGVAIGVALTVVIAADTLSIFTMEIVDNVVIAFIPSALNAGLVNPVFWLSLSLGLFIAFFAAYPVNKYQLTKGKGHSLLHKYHQKGKK